MSCENNNEKCKCGENCLCSKPNVKTTTNEDKLVSHFSVPKNEKYAPNRKENKKVEVPKELEKMWKSPRDK